jgi:hypothetical protein
MSSERRIVSDAHAGAGFPGDNAATDLNLFVRHGSPSRESLKEDVEQRNGSSRRPAPAITMIPAKFAAMV